ncbi:MAG: methylmalonyl-CoA mutase family protein [Candidatus Sumerlaeia bacterium]|nr:methylmalonyl-CoA mutase family protein [Candidatus Sumerlaeia bacterium]
MTDRYSLQEDAASQTSTTPLDLSRHFETPSLQSWRASVEKDLAGAPFEKKLHWETPEGFTVKPLYTSADQSATTPSNGMPGFAPFVRGGETMAGVCPRWQIRQDCLLASPEDVNAAIRDGLARGQTAIGIRLDNAVRRGLDGDDPNAVDKAGRGGMTISTINGVRLALQDVDLGRYPVSWRTGAAALPILAMHLAVARERGLDLRILTGSVECDPIRELAKSGHVRGGSLEPRFREMAEMVHFCALKCPGMRPVLVNSHPWHNGGASAVQELAYTLATGTEYLRQLIGFGISSNSAALSMIFSFSVSSNLFMEIAKLRAARLLWAKITKAMGVTDPEGMKMFMHSRTSALTKTKWDPWNNMIRSTVEAFAAAVGGSNSIYVAPFDEPLGRPDEFSMRIARNQQVLLQEEVHLDRVIDPAGGSYYVEALTDSLGRNAWALFQELESNGGIVEGLKTGKVQKAISAKAEKLRDAVSKRRQSVVGVSTYANPAEEPLRKSHIARKPFLAERERRLKLHKKLRSQYQVKALLASLDSALCHSRLGHVMELAIEAAQAGATIGEMTKALVGEELHGAPIFVERIPSFRIGEGFENLRDRLQSQVDLTGKRPRVLLLPFGPLGMRRARADFSRGFFAASGLDIQECAAIKTAEEAVLRVRENHPQVVVFCSDDESYPQMVPDLIKSLRGETVKLKLIVAGMPESAEALLAAGVDGFIHIRADALAELTSLFEWLEIPK